MNKLNQEEQNNIGLLSLLFSVVIAVVFNIIPFISLLKYYGIMLGFVILLTITGKIMKNK